MKKVLLILLLLATISFAQNWETGKVNGQKAAIYVDDGKLIGAVTMMGGEYWYSCPNFMNVLDHSEIGTWTTDNKNTCTVFYIVDGRSLGIEIPLEVIKDWKKGNESVFKGEYKYAQRFIYLVGFTKAFNGAFN